MSAFTEAVPVRTNCLALMFLHLPRNHNFRNSCRFVEDLPKDGSVAASLENSFLGISDFCSSVWV